MSIAKPLREELIAQGAFVRSVARALLRDPHAADDVAQETIVAALSAPPLRDGSLRPWFARTVANRARRWKRGNARRAFHERQAARPEAVPSPAERLAREEIVRLVAGAVLALEEPYRSAILDRDYVGLSPREIAERSALPLATVYTHLRRAEDQLRAKLECTKLDWRPALLLLVPEPSGAPERAERAGGRRSLRHLGAALAVAAAVLVLTSILWNAPPRRGPSPANPRSAAASAGAPLHDDVRSQNSSSQREPRMSTAVPGALLYALLALPIAPGSSITRLVSVGFDASGNPAVGDGRSRAGCISGSGRFVAFSSSASNLIWPLLDTNGHEDVFIRDLVTEQTFLVSQPPGWPTVQADGDSTDPALSPDGRFVVFSSWATNLVADDGNGTSDVFRVDVQALPALSPAVLVSLGESGQQGNGRSVQPVISGDGTVVAFGSEASNLTSNAPNTPGWDIFVRDLSAQTTVLASATSPDSQGVRPPGNTNQSEDQAISTDGRYVAFWSNATNLDALDDGDGSRDTNDDYDVFLFDRWTLTTQIVSVNPDGDSGPADGQAGDGDRPSRSPSLSGNGRYVSFVSRADDLVPLDTNESPDMFVRDMWTGTTTRVNLGPAGQVANPGLVDGGTISEDGRFVTFDSGGVQYHTPDTNGFWDVYRTDRDPDGNGLFDESHHVLTQRASCGANGEEGNGLSFVATVAASVTRNGQFVVFESASTNFSGALADTNEADDVFVRDMRRIRRP